jgi:DNA-directed RNA polymerase specialized sigma24 family protein
MERNWTKRKLTGLSQGDAETVRQWQSQYGRFLYTWLYYQLNKEESMAATVTAQTLSQALRDMSSFNPEQTTMYLWLKELAARQLGAALTQEGTKTQRPWAWSELPPKTLESLKRLRTEPLAPEAPGCAAVAEMVQATLAELSEQDRDLLVRRYTRLETVEQIASTLNLSGEQVNQQLYLARHAFRRGLFCLIQAANPDVAEPAVSGGLELFESNLESLLRSVPAAATISSDNAEQIKRAVLQTASEIAQNPPMPSASTSVNKTTKTVFAAAGVVVLVLAMVWFGRGNEQTPAAPTPGDLPSPVTEVNPSQLSVERSQPAIDAEELKRVMDIGLRGDVTGLLNVLKTGSFIAQMTAAYYLGQVGEQSAIDPLLAAQARWYPDDPQETPFSRAVIEIMERLSSAPMPELPVIVETPAAVKPVLTNEPLLSGRVILYDKSPLSGVQISLHRKMATEAGGVGPAAFTATADAEGRYSFGSLPEGPFVVSVRDPKRRIADSNRMMWAAQNRSCTLDFGGPAAVAGTVVIDGSPLGDKSLLLSDAFFNPSHGVFTAETQTDSGGGFVFTGVPSGMYGLFSRLTGTRWTLAGHVEVGAADVMMQFESPAVNLLIRAEGLPETLEIVAVSLRYSPDSSDSLAEWAAVRTEMQSVFEVNRILPGVYTLCVDFSNGVRTLRETVVTTQPEQEILLDEFPLGTAGLSGRFLSVWPEGLTLMCAEPQMRISVMAEEDGGYALNDLPSGTYTLGVSLTQTFVPYLEFGLFENQPAVYDPDPTALAKTRSPLYVYVTDAQGRGLSGGQVWLMGAGGYFVAQPIGRGYFVAAPPGRYSLTAAFAGYPAYEREVSLESSDVRAAQSEANICVVHLGQ